MAEETRDDGQIYVRRGGVYLLDQHAGVVIDSSGNFVAKTRGEPRALAAMLRLIAADIEKGTPRLAREWEGEMTAARDPEARHNNAGHPLGTVLPPEWAPIGDEQPRAGISLEALDDAAERWATDGPEGKELS